MKPCISILATFFAMSFLLATPNVHATDFGDLPKYEKADPDIDLKAAISRNDLRFKAVMGFAVDVPGVDDYFIKYEKYGLDVIKGTSDCIEGYEHGRLITIARNYASHYNIALQKHINHLESAAISKGLKGYDALTKEMTIGREVTGHINSLPESFHAGLVSRKSRCVNLAWWFNPLTNGKPSYDWNQFLTIYEEVNEVVCSHKWIQEWIQSGSNRNAEAEIFGIQPYTETNIDLFVKTAWASAGLGSEPYYEIRLREGSESFGTFFIGRDKTKALITSLKVRELYHMVKGDSLRRSRHWLDSTPAFSYHPKSKNKQYIIVDQNGKWRNGS